MQTQCGEPSFIRAGDTLKWTRTVDGYSSSDGWALSYRFMSAAAKFDVPSTADGSGGFAISVASGTTAAYAAGAYRWVARVTNGTENYTVAEGTATVLPDLADATAAMDPRTQNERILDAINNLIEGRTTSDAQSYKIHGRELVRMPMNELLQWRAEYANLVAAERSARGESTAPRIVKPVFRSRS